MANGANLTPRRVRCTRMRTHLDHYRLAHYFCRQIQ